VIPSKLENARVVFNGDRIEAFVIVSEPERAKESNVPPRDPEENAKVIAAMRMPGLVFAAPLRNPNDGRDDIVAVVRTDDAQTRTWSVVGYRWHEGKLVRVLEPSVVYSLTATNARWIGANLSDLDLILELSSRADSIEVGGLLTTRVGDKIRDIVVITPVPVARKRAKPVSHESGDAGTSDAH